MAQQGLRQTLQRGPTRLIVVQQHLALLVEDFNSACEMKEIAGHFNLSDFAPRPEALAPTRVPVSAPGQIGAARAPLGLLPERLAALSVSAARHGGYQ